MKDWLVGGVSIVAALAVASIIAFLAGPYSVAVGGWSVFVLCAIFAFVVQWVVFVHAWLTKTEIFFDLTGSITYLVMVGAAVFLSGTEDVRSLLIAGLICVWALRLGPFLYQRIKKAGEDRRFRKLKTSFPMFLMTWTLQGTWVFLTACCALAAITSPNQVPLAAPFYIGIVLWLVGFLLEVIADQQKTAFRADPANSGRFISTGLWAWSRHPNYFGEILLWLGITVMAFPVLEGGQLVTLISPIFVVVLLTFISGVRLLEVRADRIWGDEPEYQTYKRNTPTLMLWPPKG
jgi:steroid 5-alpha reductase family enzyme